jgi:hypothetical protein
VVGLFSEDAGATWGDPVVVSDGRAEGKGYWHGQLTRMRDDRLFTLFWSAEMEPMRDLPLHRSMGTPGAREWSRPEATNIPGQTNQAADLGDGRMMAVYTWREAERPGFYAALSQDGGLSWDLENQVCLWDATGRDKLGVEAPDAYPRSHDTIAFGAPRLTVLGDGDLMATFWCTEMSITHVRYARLRVG